MREYTAKIQVDEHEDLPISDVIEMFQTETPFDVMDSLTDLLIYSTTKVEFAVKDIK